jgi:uncharacterized membrane protein
MLLAITLIVILWLNYLTDYLFQTKKMSENKHHSILWLLAHIGVFTLSFGILVFIWNFMFNSFTPLNLFHLLWINTLTHFIIDYITSKITASLYKKQKFGLFLRVIGADQTLHATILVWLTCIFFGV